MRAKLAAVASTAAPTRRSASSERSRRRCPLLRGERAAARPSRCPRLAPVTSAIRPRDRTATAHVWQSTRIFIAGLPARSSANTSGHALERLDGRDQPLEPERAVGDQLDRRLEVLRLVHPRARAASSSFQKRSKSATGFGSGKIATTTTRPRIAACSGCREDALRPSPRPRSTTSAPPLSVSAIDRRVSPGSSAVRPKLLSERTTCHVRLDDEDLALREHGRRARSAFRCGPPPITTAV